jgi:hypothetical protein
VVELKFVSFKDRVNLAAVSLMLVSLFGFIGNVMIDYNWGTNPVSNSIAIAYWMTLRWMVPFPLNYWGVGAVVYFALFLLAFAVLNRKEGLAWNMFETLRLASMILALFELGVFFSVPGYMDKWVIQAFYGTPLAFFTNWDLLTGSLASTIGFHLVLTRMRLSHRFAGSAT